MALSFSTYQIALFNVIENDNCSIVLDAKAGAGKTTTILEACNRLPERASVLFLAFNKAIVGELSEKLPAGVNCRTFNSCGWGAWRSFTGRKYIKIDAKKTWRIIWDMLSREDSRLYGAFINKMVGLAKSSGLTPDSDSSEWWAVQDHHGVTLNSMDADYSEAMDCTVRVLRESIRQAYDVCDFDDQIYMPWLRNATFQRYDYIFIDEAQDTNEIQCDLLRRMLKPGGRLIAVGDPNQAIYGFRGADHNAMNNIRNAFGATELPLSISYRCAKNIIAEAQKYVSDIQAFDSAPDGTVEHVDGYTIETFNASDAILCRNNAPLIEIAYQFIARGKGVNFLGRDIGAGLKSLVKNMEARDLDDLEDKLDLWLGKESEKLIKKHQEEKVEILEDRVKCISIFIANLPQSRQTVGDLLDAIDALFQSKGRGITLSSVHKSKGREWDRVYILDFGTYMPSKYARKDWQKIQERNLIYVAITRAKRYLGYLPSGMWKDAPNMVIPERTRKPAPATPIRKTAAKTGLNGSFNPFAK